MSDNHMMENEHLFDINKLQQSKTFNPPNYLANTTPIDQVVSNQAMYILKSALPYLNYSLQKQLALFIKISELKNTLQIYDKNNFENIKSLNLMSKPKEEMLHTIRSSCSEEYKNIIDIVLNIINVNKLIQKQQLQKQKNTESNKEETNESVKTNLNEQLNNEKNTIDSSMIDSLKCLLTPEQQNMFDMFSMMMKTNQSGKEPQNESK